MMPSGVLVPRRWPAAPTRRPDSRPCARRTSHLRCRRTPTSARRWHWRVRRRPAAGTTAGVAGRAGARPGCRPRSAHRRRPRARLRCGRVRRKPVRWWPRGCARRDRHGPERPRDQRRPHQRRSPDAGLVRLDRRRSGRSERAWTRLCDPGPGRGGFGPSGGDPLPQRRPWGESRTARPFRARAGVSHRLAWVGAVSRAAHRRLQHQRRASARRRHRPIHRRGRRSPTTGAGHSGAPQRVA
jgi:hypothetical protein